MGRASIARRILALCAVLPLVVGGVRAGHHYGHVRRFGFDRSRWGAER